jgi:hypothetical protein
VKREKHQTRKGRKDEKPRILISIPGLGQLLSSVSQLRHRSTHTTSGDRSRAGRETSQVCYHSQVA